MTNINCSDLPDFRDESGNYISGIQAALDGIMTDYNVSEKHVVLAGEIASTMALQGRFGILKDFFDSICEQNMDKFKNNESFLRAMIALNFEQKKYADVFSLLEKGKFSSNTGLLEIWDQAHYGEKEEELGRPLTPLIRFRIRKRYPPPNNICPNGERPNTKLSHGSKAVLKNWFIENIQNPYPSAETKQELADKTGLTAYQVKTWFANARRRQQKVCNKPKKTENGPLILNKEVSGAWPHNYCANYRPNVQDCSLSVQKSPSSTCTRSGEYLYNISPPKSAGEPAVTIAPTSSVDFFSSTISRYSGNSLIAVTEPVLSGYHSKSVPVYARDFLLNNRPRCCGDYISGYEPAPIREYLTINTSQPTEYLMDIAPQSSRDCLQELARMCECLGTGHQTGMAQVQSQCLPLQTTQRCWQGGYNEMSHPWREQTVVPDLHYTRQVPASHISEASVGYQDQFYTTVPTTNSVPEKHLEIHPNMIVAVSEGQGHMYPHYDVHNFTNFSRQGVIPNIETAASLPNSMQEMHSNSGDDVISDPYPMTFEDQTINYQVDHLQSADHEVAMVLLDLSSDRSGQSSQSSLT